MNGRVSLKVKGILSKLNVVLLWMYIFVLLEYNVNINGLLQCMDSCLPWLNLSAALLVSHHLETPLTSGTDRDANFNIIQQSKSFMRILEVLLTYWLWEGCVIIIITVITLIVHVDIIFCLLQIAINNEWNHHNHATDKPLLSTVSEQQNQGQICRYEHRTFKLYFCSSVTLNIDKNHPIIIMGW